MKIRKVLEKGSKRIKSKDLNLYEKKQFYWKFYSKPSRTSRNIIDLYLKYDNLNLLVDIKNKVFLKGFINSNNQISGERIKFLPSGKELARGGFSIFAEDLKINTSLNKNSWDICYKNTSGTKTYLYSIDKIHLEQEEKFKIVKKFKENFKNIIQNLEKDIKNNFEIKYLALYILIKTKIRVGNYHYYLQTKHMGLTTLKKRNIILLKNNLVEFNFIGKDGVPQNIIQEFPEYIILHLKELLKNKKQNDFIFITKNNLPLHSEVFSNILFKYTKIHFYPHIIRSYYADSECEKFLRKEKKITKEIFNKKLNEIALNLGHKKYNKKKKVWEVSSKVTIDSYIYPKLIEKINDKIK